MAFSFLQLVLPTSRQLLVKGQGQVGVGVLTTQLVRLRRRLDPLPDDGDLYHSVLKLDRDLTLVEEGLASLQPVVQALSDRMPGALRYAAVVTYDAHADQAGNLSRSIALLNERRDGLVITLLHGREDSTFFTKMIRAGRGVEPLSPEEQTAVERAVGN